MRPEWRAGKRRLATSLVDDVEGAVDDVVELEGVVRLREALQVQRVVLHHRGETVKDEISTQFLRRPRRDCIGSDLHDPTRASERGGGS